MLFALGAASTALDAIQSLTSPKSSSPPVTGFDAASTDPFAVSTPTSASSTPTTGGNGFSQLSPATMSALLAAQGQSSTATATPASTSPSSALQDLFSQIDSNGDGQISKSEFENALGADGTNIAQADDVFSKMDKNGDGSVSLDEMSSALKGSGSKGGHHHHMHVGGSGGSTGASGAATSADGSTDPLLQALAGATSSSVTNSDGSTTTSITNPDGSKITMTSPAATTSSSTATASYNFLEQMIQRAAQAISSNATQSLSMNI
jgi:EF hand domain-containing protein